MVDELDAELVGVVLDIEADERQRLREIAEKDPRRCRWARRQQAHDFMVLYGLCGAIFGVTDDHVPACDALGQVLFEVGVG